MKQCNAAVYATGLQLRSGDTHVRANRQSSLLFFIIQFPYLQQILRLPGVNNFYAKWATGELRYLSLNRLSIIMNTKLLNVLNKKN